jgi:hypothetical protein
MAQDAAATPSTGIRSACAAAALWLPPLVPFVTGPLTECSHCVANYGRMYAVIPGFWPGATVGLAYGDSDSWLAIGVMAATTLVLLVAVIGALGRGRLLGAGALLFAALLSGASGWVLGHALRM